MHDRWLNLPALTTYCSGDGAQRRCRCAPPLAHDRGFHPPQMPPATATEVARRLHTATAHPHLAAQLATAVFTAASDAQLQTARPSDLTAEAATIALHDADGLRFGSAASPTRAALGPPLLLAAAYQHAIAEAGDTRCSPPFTGNDLPHLFDLADSCKLRPPQPPKPRARPGRPPPKPQNQRTIWPFSNAHYRYPWAAGRDHARLPAPTPGAGNRPPPPPACPGPRGRHPAGFSLQLTFP
ncbi:hypothetical protein HUT16_00025 [Kitasatospora sp. NA04385]|uniref:hypothetical protein n=1 Tax=Kitasatospora sp. NA04385 TaxID=2742135 RepID=UPI001591898A|nr:hypothetical protein [Kitasatospora sp. NA04385]QKW17666.1 hypothetical protein HUT16_00025 [Kitasatospora sp. NA04385]